MAREARRVSIGMCETITITISQEPEEETPLSMDEQQALEEWLQQARREKDEDRALSTRQHALIALGRAAEWRACVEVYMREPTMPQRADLINQTDMHQEGPQHVLVPPPARPRRPAPRARQWNIIAQNDYALPQLPDVHTHRVRRPAPKARQRSMPSDTAVIHQPVEAAQVARSDEGTRTDCFDGNDAPSSTSPTRSVARGDGSEVSLSR
eukprot:TRINITY_DN19137_c1_g1_i1.p1 TRINITY_DN19137_c1_g1~~TRINITY_DN19137_c1_g1_i1.p1  ORF type:complete len:211 (-),score=32.47 TRINITY_DN19137_c1_g1_i1:92-724(-)